MPVRTSLTKVMLQNGQMLVFNGRCIHEIRTALRSKAPVIEIAVPPFNPQEDVELEESTFLIPSHLIALAHEFVGELPTEEELAEQQAARVAELEAESDEAISLRLSDE